MKQPTFLLVALSTLGRHPQRRRSRNRIGNRKVVAMSSGGVATTEDKTKHGASSHEMRSQKPTQTRQNTSSSCPHQRCQSGFTTRSDVLAETPFPHLRWHVPGLLFADIHACSVSGGCPSAIGLRSQEEHSEGHVALGAGPMPRRRSDSGCGSVITKNRALATRCL